MPVFFLMWLVHAMVVCVGVVMVSSDEIIVDEFERLCAFCLLLSLDVSVHFSGFLVPFVHRVAGAVCAFF